MIKKIVIRDVASYDHEGCTFDDLAKVNIIYGGNGTGKTTLSRVMGDSYGRSNETCNVDLDMNQARIYVFNRYRKEEFFQEKISGVFTLNNIPKEDDEKLNRLRPRRQALFKELRKADYETAHEKELLLEELQDVDHRIKEMEQRLTTPKPVIENINKMLKYYGFTSFSIQPINEDCSIYQLQRPDGSYVEDTLSEGEASFISFLYFIQLLKGDIFGFHVLEPKVVVIDDPICSLDSNILYVVSMIMRGLIEEVIAGTSPVKQLFILTHNVAFHKNVSQRSPHKDIHYWMLTKQNGVTKATAYGEENPVRSEYEMLWQEVREAKKGVVKAGLANTMRRIIETYFVENGGYTKRRLIPDGFIEDPEELVIMTSLAKWLDEGSHGVTENLYSEIPQISNEAYLDVFHRFFVKFGHEAHYKMMMREE